MIRIYIQGIKDGIHDVALEVPVEEVPSMFSEFIGKIRFKGNLRKISNRYYITGTAECNSILVCDRTLTEYEEKITAEIQLTFISENTLIKTHSNPQTDSLERVINGDDKYIDITDDIREELAVSLPMKRVAPQFRDKEFDEIYPQFSSKKKANKKTKTEITNDYWTPLKNLKLN